jgi:sugar phosphate isomerase/epimerase
MPQQAPSVQLWSIRDPFGEDMNGSLAKLAEIGFTRVEPFGHGDFSDGGFFDELAAALKANKLSAPTIHFQMYGKDLEPFFGAAKKLGVQTIIDPMIDPELWKTRASVIEVANAVSAIADEAEKHGLKIGYHNHHFEFLNIIDGVAAYDIFVEHISPKVVLELDTYWATVGGANAVEVLQRLGDRVVAIHVKDGKLGLEYPEIVEHQLPAGTGEVPVAAILAAAPNAIPVVEFDKFNGEIFAAVAQSLAFVNGHRA